MNARTIFRTACTLTGIMLVAPAARAQDIGEEPDQRAQHAQATPAENDVFTSLWVASVRIDQRSPGGSGGTGSIDWVRGVQWGYVLLGADVTTLRGTRWTVARVGITWLPHRRLSLATKVEAGPGWSGETFLYRRTVSEAGYAVIPGRLMLSTMHQYFSVQNLYGHVVQPMADLGFGPAAARVGYGVSIAGYDTDYLFVRGSYTRRNLSGFAGASVGRFIPDLATELESPPGTESLYEIFGGLTIPIERLALTIAISRYATASAARHSVQFVTRVPAP